MSREQISSYVLRQMRLRIDKAAEALGISTSKYIEQAVETDLDKLDIREDLKRQKQNNEKLVHERDTARVERDNAKASAEAARKQRDNFKAKYEGALSDLAVAEAKIEALKDRGLFARIFNRNPKI